jgi:transcription elongation factor GreB
MSKAFTRESDEDEDDAPPDGLPALPPGSKNYLTPAGHAALQREFETLWHGERPKLVETVSWAASNGDRSENGDYLYGKKRLREIDRRLRYLGKRLENAEVVDPATREATDQVFFGATVTLLDEQGQQSRYSIVGIDEADVSRGRVSWLSPLARTLLKAREGSTVRLPTPGGMRLLEIMSVEYLPID